MADTRTYEAGVTFRALKLRIVKRAVTYATSSR
jgi:hypothetical protein